MIKDILFRSRPIVFVVLLIFFPSARSLGAIITDGTVGPAKNLTGPNFKIGPNLGIVRGSNLFHSFLRFNILTGESATFTGPGSIANVISRVTGGEASTINGLLKSEVGNANFFFINPAGIVFGPKAKVDVPAAFHVSTADQLRFSDGKVFSATNTGASTLTAAQPEAFGFLSPQPAGITLNGSRLEFALGSEVSLSAGDIVISGFQESEAGVRAEGGNIYLTAVGDLSGEVTLKGISGADWRGRLLLENADVDSSGEGGGLVALNAGETGIYGSTLFADNSGATDSNGGVRILAENLDTARSAVTADTLAEGNAGTLEIGVRNSMIITDGTMIRSGTFASGNAGNLWVKAGELRIDGQGSDFFTGISAKAGGGSTGHSGSVTIEISGLMEVLNGGEVSSSTLAQGDAGNIQVRAGALRVDGKGSEWLTRISSQAAQESIGRAGSVTIETAGLMEVLNGGCVDSSTFSEGNARNVLVKAGELRIDGQELVTGISSQANNGTGSAGSITIETTGLMEVLNGGIVSSDTSSQGNAGSVQVKAAQLRIDGQELVTGISSQANTLTGSAGSITIEITGLMEVLNGGRVSSSTFSQKTAGSVQVKAGQLRIDGQNSLTGIWSDARSGGAGNAGSVTIETTGLMEVLNGGIVSSDTSSEGDAGSLHITAGELRIDRQDSYYTTGITSKAYSSSGGDAGSVYIETAGLMQVLNGGEVSSGTFSHGNAGSVQVKGDQLSIDGQGSEWFTGISSQANSGTGSAGSITIETTGLVKILNGGMVSSGTFSQGNAGNVQVSADDLRIDGQGSKFFTGVSSSASQNATGRVGEIEITANRIQVSNEGAVSIAHHGSIPSSALTGFTPGHLWIDAGILHLQSGSELSALSEGNAPASSILLNITDRLIIEGSSQITTSATGTGDGGNITIDPLLTILRDGLITTSSASGRGGDISLRSDVLILDTGFIQANAAAGARGGDIFIDTRALIAEGGNLQVGGAVRQEFVAGSGLNVIQAAAPGGEQGVISITSPEIDIAGSLVDLGVRWAEGLSLAMDPCFTAFGAAGNSLVQGGRGGVAWTFDQPAEVSFSRDRLDELMFSAGSNN